MKSNIQNETGYHSEAEWHLDLKLFKCKICGIAFEVSEITAWEIHKLNHTLVSLKNIIDRKGDRLY